MKNQVIICDLSVLNGRFKYVKNAMLLLNVLINCCTLSTNLLEMNRQDMIEALSDGAEHEYTDKSIKMWLTLLAKNGAIKYRMGKYNYKIMLNPRYVFNGTQEAFDKALETWNKFKSDVDFVD